MRIKNNNRRLIISFIVIAVLPFILSNIFAYHNNKTLLLDYARDKLINLRDKQADYISDWLKKCEGDIKRLAKNQEIINYLKKYSDKKVENSKSVKKLQKIIRYFSVNENYIDIIIVDQKNGQSIVHAWPIDRSKMNDHFYNKINTLNKPTIFNKTDSSNLYQKKILVMNYKIALNIDAIYKLVFIVNLEDSVLKTLHDRSKLGETGEILLFNENFDIINDLRWDNNSGKMLNLKEIFPLEISGYKSDVYEIEDYRKIKVLAVTTIFSELNWKLLVKQDIKEVLAPIDDQFLDTILTVVVLIVGIYLVFSGLLRISLTKEK